MREREPGVMRIERGAMTAGGDGITAEIASTSYDFFRSEANVKNISITNEATM